MKIVVCVKQVPDTSEVEIDPKTNTLIRTGIPVIINPDDKSAIEFALELRKQAPGSTVTVMTMGPAQAKNALREALAMGCDDAVLISSREFGGSDTLATSTILAAALTKHGFDLVLAGRQAIDGDTAQVGPQIAEHLGIPQATYAQEVTLDGGHVTVLRQFEDRYHRLRLPLPCLVTAISENTQPRYMTVAGIVDAGQKEIAQMDYAALQDLLDPAAIGLKGSPTNVARTYTKQPKAQGTILKGLTPEQAVEAIMARLHEGHIL